MQSVPRCIYVPERKTRPQVSVSKTVHVMQSLWELHHLEFPLFLHKFHLNHCQSQTCFSAGFWGFWKQPLALGHDWVLEPPVLIWSPQNLFYFDQTNPSNRSAPSHWQHCISHRRGCTFSFATKLKEKASWSYLTIFCSKRNQPSLCTFFAQSFFTTDVKFICEWIASRDGAGQECIPH